MPHRPLFRAFLGLVIVAAAFAALYVSGVLPGSVHYLPIAHTWSVGLMSLISFAVAGKVAAAAWHRHDLRTGLVASGFLAFAWMLVLHSVATPGGYVFALEDAVHTAEVSGVFSIPLGAMYIAAAMLLSPRAAGSQQRLVVIGSVTVIALSAFTAVGLFAPQLLPSVALMLPPVSVFVLVPTVALLAVASWRAGYVASLTNRGGDALVFAGTVMLSASIVLYVTSVPFNVQFWVGHLMEFSGFAALSLGVVKDIRRPMSTWRLTQNIDGIALIESSEEVLGGYVHALTVTLAQVDPHTWEHSRRVAQYAVLVGEEMGASPATVRRLAIAGLVHDIGKLRIPRDVLHKAGKLDDEEFDMIKQHPAWGVDILKNLRGFSGEIPLVRGHHEKLSGRGYPDSLEGAQISLETRIMTACDVYDALTDSRSYKQAWPIPKALKLLHDESGESFDPDVVQALERVIERQEARRHQLEAASDSVVSIVPEIQATAPAQSLEEDSRAA